MNNWFVYIVRCNDNTLYTGIAKSVERRVDEHNCNDTLGSKYTRTRRPVRLVYQEETASRSAAGKREFAIKQLNKTEKESLIARTKTH